MIRRQTLSLAAFAALTVLSSLPTSAQTIYPLDRAEILSGAKFDLKVEFSGAPAPGEIAVRINGRPAQDFLAKPATFIAREDGGPNSAYWIRDVQLTEPGAYTIEAQYLTKENAYATSSVRWEVYGTPPAKARNVILFVGDGMAIAHRTAARMLSKGIKEGRYGGELAMDDMPHMALVSTAGSDSIITDSANSMSSYTTGHKTCANALGVYCAANKNPLEHPKVETITEIVKRKRGMGVGVVTNTEIEDATPAGMVAHVRLRWLYDDVVRMFHEVKPEVILGGGSVNFLPKSKPGSRRADEIDYIAKFQDDGYRVVTTDAEMKTAAGDTNTKRLLGLFNTGNIDGALDRHVLKKGTVPRFPDQPDLVDQMLTALAILSRNDQGFVLMVESGRIDKYTHSLDWERAVYDTIMLDNAVKAAKDWAALRRDSKLNDTLIVVVPDHAHPVSIVGTYDDDKPGQLLRDKLGVYGDAKFPNYAAPDAAGYPPSVAASRRLAFTFGAYPDHCDAGKPYVDGERAPTVKNAGSSTATANERDCRLPFAVRRTGNLPFEVGSGVHSGDDVLLTAMGPGADQFRGRMDNTRVFRVIATALGLGGK